MVSLCNYSNSLYIFNFFKWTLSEFIFVHRHIYVPKKTANVSLKF